MYKPLQTTSSYLALHNLYLFGMLNPWEWMSSGGLPGLQNRCRVAWRSEVGSTPIHSRLCEIEKP